MRFDDLTNEEWQLVEALLGDVAQPTNRRGRPRVESRAVADAVLWVLATGESWSRLPGRYPSQQTCRRRSEEWLAAGTLAQAVELLVQAGRLLTLRDDFGLASAKSSKVARPVSASVPVPHERLRGAFWANPESWRAPAEAM